MSRHFNKLVEKFTALVRLIEEDGRLQWQRWTGEKWDFVCYDIEISVPIVKPYLREEREIDTISAKLSANTYCLLDSDNSYKIADCYKGCYTREIKCTGKKPRLW